jgi:putative SOS response-associated peptidase YedK
MPVILKPEAYHAWLDPTFQQVETLRHIIENQILTELVGVPVSSQVNRVENNRPDNILPLPGG